MAIRGVAAGVRRVLAVAIDAAEPTLVRELIGRGDLPSLRALLAEGRWTRVTSPAHIGSGAVWPTFIGGADPERHGVHGEWRWQPDTMSLTRWHDAGVTPFWKELDRRGITVGVLDVPFAPLIGVTRGFEVSEWGPHDAVRGRMAMAPAGLVAAVNGLDPHPFVTRRLDAAGPEDHEALTALSRACLAGVRLRGNLAKRLIAKSEPALTLVVFPEIHHAAHHLWHTIEPGHAFYGDSRFRRSPTPVPGLVEILREVDRQIGELVAAVGPRAAVFVFALHGMRPTRGVPALLEPLLCETGFSRYSEWRARSWRDRARAGFAALKRRAPRRLKQLYYRSMSRAVTQRLAQTTMLPAYDWRHTRAFSLPSDQHGWIRLNLAGRETEGIVGARHYDETCRELCDLLRAVTTDDGRPIVRDVIRPAGEDGGAPPRGLPDLVVHWHDAAFDAPVRLRDHAVHAFPTGMKFTGQHAPDGFCVANGAVAGAGAGSSVPARDLHRWMTAGLGL